MTHLGLLVATAAALLLRPVVDAKSSQYTIFWNTTNPMFRIDNTDNVLDINVGNQPWEYDQANIICPLYLRGTRDADMERYIIYSVSKEEYENCNIADAIPRVIAVCDKPHKLLYFTITFRSFTPTPGGLEFKPGHDYYFISTSSQNDLHRRKGGRCTTHNMRLMFKIASSSPREPEAPGGQLPDEYLSPTREISQELTSNSLESEQQNPHRFVNPGEANVVKQASVVASTGSGSSSRPRSSYGTVLVTVWATLCLMLWT